jgi:NAD(P)-dependent dehydrogenase (short-subunit alcohol dehydrogenase family)
MANNIAVVVGVGRGLGWALARRFSRGSDRDIESSVGDISSQWSERREI